MRYRIYLIQVCYRVVMHNILKLLKRRFYHSQSTQTNKPILNNTYNAYASLSTHERVYLKLIYYKY